MKELKLPRARKADPLKGTSLVRVKEPTSAILDRLTKLAVDNIELVDRP